MKNKLKTLLFVAALSPLGTNAQVVDTTKYTDYTPFMGEPDPSLLVYGSANHGKPVKAVDVSQRPDHVNNMEARCFPPVFNQAGGSCGSASRIGYMFTHEMNAFRNVDGSLEENLYPTHFVWLFTRGNSGKEAFVTDVGVPSAATYGGRTYSALFGNQSDGDEAFGWMNGYDKWYSGMFNRVETVAQIPANVSSAEGREAVKNWLWNHNGDADYAVGGLAGIGVATGTLKDIPSTPTNDEIGLTGLKCVDHWGDQVNHALTIVGYDDRVEFDLDGDGVFGEADADEKGAWIIVNSWGTKWGNGGAIYCPYAYGGKRFNLNADGSYTFDTRNWWSVQVYEVRKNYRPLRTIKLKMDYSHRSEMCLSAGVSSDINATSPERTQYFHHFHYAGDGAKGEKNPAPAVPMLGRWADGKLHSEPMEFGYDLTDLTAGYDRSQPLKYFFYIDTRVWGVGKGHIYDAAIVDYEFDKNGVEFPFDLNGENVEIKSQGHTTVITAIVQGENFSAPAHVAIDENLLSWETPQNVMHEVVGYKIYKNKVLVAEVGKDVHQYTLEADEQVATYGVTTVYANQVESVANNVMGTGVKPHANQVVDLDKGGFIINDLFKTNYDKATIEFWVDVQSLDNGAFEIDLPRSHFSIVGGADGKLSMGWNEGSGTYITTGSSVLPKKRWTHVAVIVNHDVADLYVNGNKYGRVKSPTRSGLGNMDILNFHKGKSTSVIDAKFDEIRIWDYAKSYSEIRRDYKSEYPGHVYPKGLLAYYKGQIVKQGYKDYLFDCVGGHHAVLSGVGETVSDFSLRLPEPTAVPGMVKIALPSDTVHVGQLAALQADYSVSVNDLKWTVPALNIKDLDMTSPKVKFDKVGKYEVYVTAATVGGNTVCDTAEVNVVSAPTASAEFILSQPTIAVGDRLSVHVAHPVEGCRYEWSMPGADQPEQVAVNASGVYAQLGKYTITLRAINAEGKTVTASKDIEVVEVAPIADFDVAPAIIEKGNTIFLKDKSKYNPSSWKWTLRSANKNIIVDGQQSSLTLNATGVYDLSLKVANSKGEDEKSREGAVIVCNADSKTGLNFSPSSARVVMSKVPLKAQSSRFTIEWWMNMNQMLTYCNGMGESEKTMLLRCNGDGVMQLLLNGKTTQSDRMFVHYYGWHHYAVSFNLGQVKFYCDGRLVSTRMSEISSVPMMKEFALGLPNIKMTSMIDEFRIWGSCLTEKEIQQYANAPIEDVKKAEADRNLLLYYDFNQSGGDVLDATSNQNTGLRRGFGPDGDAWGLSSGVFSLNFDDVQMKDVTASYLKNYKAPFAYDGDKTTHETGPYCHAIADWTLENTNTSNGRTAGVYVDANKRNLFTCQTGWDGFGDLVNHKAYQTMTLPAGAYEFVANYGYHKSSARSALMVVAPGKTLPNPEDCPTEALAVKVMQGRTSSVMSNTLSFLIEKPTEVSLGLVLNMSGKQCFILNDFVLRMSPFEYHEADGAVGYDLAVDASGYNTLYLPYAVTIPEGVTAYVAELIENGKVTMKPIMDGVIPAHTGVLVAAATGSYRFAPTSALGKARSLLKGTFEDMAVMTDSRYYLLDTTEKAEFRWFQGETIPANRAYFTTDKNDETAVYAIDLVPVGIESVEANAATEKVYDVLGRRIQSTTSGLQISKGKKVWVK